MDHSKPLTSLTIDLSKVDVFADDPISTPEYRAAIIYLRELHGAPLQWKANREKIAASPCKTWIDWPLIVSPSWTWDQHVFRVNPSWAPRKWVAWDSADEIPMPTLWIRKKSGNAPALLVTSLGTSTIGVLGSRADSTHGIDLETLFEQYECSTTGRAPWGPCGKQVIA